MTSLSCRAASLSLGVLLVASPLGAQFVFEPLVEIPLLNGARAATLADLDEDGILDLLVTPDIENFLGSGVTYNVLEGVGDGSLLPPVAGQTLGTNILGRGEVVDIDGDGHLDWVVPDGEGLGRVYVFEGSADLLFGSFTGYGSSSAGSGADARVVDLVGDDDHLDIVKLGINNNPFVNSGEFRALIANGVGSFTEVGGEDILYESSGHSLAVGDLDGDGLQDVVITNSTLGNISIYLATTATSWGPGQVLTTGGQTPLQVEVLDLDGNGDADLLVANWEGGLLVFPGRGDGTFDPPVAAPAPQWTSSFDLGDLDGDGELDVATTRTSAAVDVFRGAGDGTFTLETTIPSTGPRGIDLGDMDSDGDLDLAFVIEVNPFGPDAVGVLINRSYGPGSPFTDLGQALAGAQGLPLQIGEGEVLPGTPLRLDLFGAVPGEAGFFVAGGSAINAPFFGGVFVPAPDGIRAYPIGGDGQVHLSPTWPATIPSGSVLYLQWWFEDAAGVFGWAGSNALRIDVP